MLKHNKKKRRNTIKKEETQDYGFTRKSPANPCTAVVNGFHSDARLYTGQASIGCHFLWVTTG